MLPTQKRSSVSEDSSHCHTKKMVKKLVREEKLRKEVIWSKNAKNRLGGEKQRTRLGSIRYNDMQVKKGKEDSLCSNPVRQLAKGIVTTYKTKVALCQKNLSTTQKYRSGMTISKIFYVVQ